MNLETLRLAEEKGVNIKLWYGEKQIPRFELMKRHWDMFLAEKYDELAADIAEHIENATAKKDSYKKANYFAELATEGKARVAEGIISVMDQGELDVNDLVGTWVQYVTSAGNVLPTKYEITAENLASRLAVIRGKKYTVKWCAPLEVVTELVSDHHNKKARAARKVKAA